MITTYLLVLSTIIFVIISVWVSAKYKTNVTVFVPYIVISVYLMSIACLITYAIEELK